MILVVETLTLPSSSSFLSLIHNNHNGNTKRRHRFLTLVSASNVSRDPWNQNHYAVLGISPGASTADIKQAYRSLSKKYHPDVSKEIEAGAIFKSINSAYKVLSNEKTRAVYDRKLELLQSRASIKPSRQWAHQEYEVDQTMRVYRWSELKKQRHRQWHYDDERSRNSARKAKNINGFKVGSFTDMLKHALFVLSIILVLGHRTGLVLHSLIAILDEELDSGYKLGYVIASLLGGRGGVLLTFSLLFLSRLFGKTSSGAIASALATIYVGVDIGRFVPLPRGALLALVYMTMKLQAI